MTNQRMVACLKFVRRRLGQVEALIDLFQTELETNMLSEKLPLGPALLVTVIRAIWSINEFRKVTN